MFHAHHKWGQDKSAVHAPFISLFYDLVFVGIALSLGDLMKTSSMHARSRQRRAQRRQQRKQQRQRGRRRRRQQRQQQQQPQQPIARGVLVGPSRVRQHVLWHPARLCLLFGVLWALVHAHLFNARFVAKGLVHVAAGIVLFCCFYSWPRHRVSPSHQGRSGHLFTFALLQASLFLGWIMRYLQIAACPEVNARQAAVPWSSQMPSRSSLLALLSSPSACRLACPASGPSGH